MPATPPNVFQSDVSIYGNLSAKTMTPIANSINDASVPAGAAISALKLGQQIRKVYAQAGNAASEVKPLYRVYGATFTLQQFVVSCIGAAVGAATVTFDLKKNGVTVLTGVVTINNSVAAYGSVFGTLSTTAAVAGDVFTVTTVATAGGGTLPTGVMAEMVGLEDPV